MERKLVRGAKGALIALAISLLAVLFGLAVDWVVSVAGPVAGVVVLLMGAGFVIGLLD